MMIKSLANHYDAVEAWLQEQHPYDVPEVVALPVSSVSENYREWLETSVKKL
jgi:periplasmic divalent cation tolerance protein